jgi:cytochrome c-type biogenesis protein CcmH/NrfG
MTLAASYPLLDAFWTILEVFFFALWIWLVISVFVDIFRSHDLSGFAKALWVLFILVLPLFGVLAYLIVRGGEMHERAIRMNQAQHQAMQSYVRDLAGSTSVADELSKLAALRDQGVLSPEEFEVQKAKILDSNAGAQRQS